MFRKVFLLLWVFVFFCYIALLVYPQDTDKSSATGLYRELLDKKVATVQDSFLILATLIKNKTVYDVEEAKQTLIGEKILTKEEVSKAKLTNPLKHSFLAYLLFKTLNLKGGLMIRILGVTPRYALKECIYAGLIKGEFSSKYISGAELLSILSRAKEYRDRNKPK